MKVKSRVWTDEKDTMYVSHSLCLFLILVDIFCSFPDMVVTCFPVQVDKYLISLTVFLKSFVYL